MEIRLLHTDDCHVWKEALSQLESALAEVGLAVKYEVINVKSTEEAQKYKFAGSPSIQIDGEDIDPRAKGIKTYTVVACRPYFYNGKSFDYPPKEMLVEELKKL